MLAAGVVTAVVLVVLAAVGGPQRALCLVLLVVPASFLALGAIKVTVTPAQVTVSSVLLPFLTFRRIPLHRIESASARRTSPLEIGGWGYRWKPGLRAVSLRAGDALWLDLANGTRFVVTIDDAQTAATLINSNLAERGGRG